MPRLIKKRSKKSGLLPGTLVHIGEKRDKDVKIFVIDYDEANVLETELKAIEECIPLKEKPTVTWINVEGLHQPDIIQKLGDCFSLHPLVLEDILNTDQRPKIEDHGEYIYIVLKMLHKVNRAEFAAEQISIILGKNFVISFQEGIKGDAFDLIRERIRSGKGRIRGFGTDYLVYSLIDAIVDNYFVILEEIGERIENIEDELVKNPQAQTLHRIHGFKREMIYLRKAVWPLREVISALERKESPLVKDTTSIYLRDVYDHTIQVIDTIESYREMLSGMLDIYLSSISNRMNEIMKFLTVIGTIFIPLTFIVGIYGMNFEFIPELKWRYGYFIVISGMSAIAVLMLFYFKKKKWL
ncbi:MAG: magnesium and cobalt transport protein CorA [Deltaproteobacteria bacterium GWC2_42_11]|nr:MAG: magnesium and cobalt transport protein CorA [Deltaproteobacteria bacterium GWC2_42_11]HBO84242.1 magnesium and cobalt transport protein CorA [Deltaproteobacteria bacterium]